jgi:hypothetical protein
MQMHSARCSANLASSANCPFSFFENFLLLSAFAEYDSIAKMQPARASRYSIFSLLSHGHQLWWPFLYVLSHRPKPVIASPQAKQSFLMFRLLRRLLPPRNDELKSNFA